VAIEPKPRPRAFRIGGSNNARVDAPPPATVIESKIDHYEVEAMAWIAARDLGSVPVKASTEKKTS